MVDNPNNVFMDGFDWGGTTAMTGLGAYGTYGQYTNPSNDLVFVTGRFGIGKALRFPYAINLPAGVAHGRVSAQGVMGVAVRHTTSNLDEYRRVLAVCEGTAVGPQMLIDTLGRLVVATGSTLRIVHTQALGLNAWHYAELDYYVHATLGYVRLILNGKIVGTVENIDTRGGTTGTPNLITFGNYLGGYLLPSSTHDGAGIDLDDFYVQDASALGSHWGPMTIETLLPTSENSNTGWTASSGTTPDAVANSITSATTPNITADDVNDVILFDSTGELTINPVTVHGVQVKYFGNKSDAGTRLVSAVLKPTSTQRVADVEDAPAETASLLHHFWKLNPDDASPWSKATIEATAFGIKITT